MVREMQTVLEDRQSIADLMTGWIHRDLAEWDKLRELFHPDGSIEISWFEGLASDFVDGSMRMGKSEYYILAVRGFEGRITIPAEAQGPCAILLASFSDALRALETVSKEDGLIDKHLLWFGKR
jgi:hypothetical protein